MDRPSNQPTKSVVFRLPRRSMDIVVSRIILCEIMYNISICIHMKEKPIVPSSSFDSLSLEAKVEYIPGFVPFLFLSFLFAMFHFSERKKNWDQRLVCSGL